MILFLLAKKLIDNIAFVFSGIVITFRSMTNLRHVVIKLMDGINPYGRIHFKFFIEETGEVTWEGWRCNLVVNTGKYHIADQLSGKLEAQMSHMAVGTGTTPAQAADTALENELDRNALDSITQGEGTAANQVTYKCTWAAGDGTGALTESGLFNSASAGKMMCRSVFAVKNKEELEAMAMDWILTISA
ncbi:MAG: phage tail protein [Desulfobulbaceae bacterium]|nr:phage tail protein [Desulfobulbaceae bacterium]